MKTGNAWKVTGICVAASGEKLRRHDRVQPQREASAQGRNDTIENPVPEVVDPDRRVEEQLHRSGRNYGRARDAERTALSTSSTKMASSRLITMASVSVRVLSTRLAR
jgi:hypothetical protein